MHTVLAQNEGHDYHVLLVADDGETVVGAWPATAGDLDKYFEDGWDPEYWEPTWPGLTAVPDYGEVVGRHGKIDIDRELLTVEAWLVQATVGTHGNGEDTFRWECLPLAHATTPDEAIEIVGARDWYYTGGRFHEARTDIFARRAQVLRHVVGTSAQGAPGTLSTPAL